MKKQNTADNITEHKMSDKNKKTAIRNFIDDIRFGKINIPQGFTLTEFVASEFNVSRADISQILVEHYNNPSIRVQLNG